MLGPQRPNQVPQAHGLANRPGASFMPDNPRQQAAAGRGPARNRTPILDLFPEVRVFNFGANGLFIPPGYTPCPAGFHAWFGIGRIDLLAAIGMEGALAAVKCSLLPTYPDDPVDLQWGDKWGNGAAIVIGQGLPFDALNAWTYKGCDIPAITSIVSTGQRAYWHVENFPTGSQSNTIPIRQNTFTFFGGGLARLPATTTLDLAFVLNRTQYNNADVGGEAINVRFAVTCYVLPTKIINNFNNLG